ncbi:prepilin-type N-terminal cleavage/methylation domain-containing protein [Niveibacterium sp.]|uniref:prepilin-type N-terminal cleavage/methylation domain-containing protein n=1 Tax=Niveibacterium sp. TaxID=2017444 RepID=UPI0035B0D8EC
MKRQAGFTLVEIAIVLVIIGLLLGGVLKGQELIESAKVKNIAQDMRAISVAVLTYQDKYRALPGDDTKAGGTTGRWGTGACSVTGAGNGVIDGDPFAAKDSSTEPICAWEHLRRAGLLTGEVTDGNPKHTDLGVFGLTSSPISNDTTRLRGVLYICANNVRGRRVIPLDALMDDGDPATGSMVTTKALTAADGGFKLTPLSSGSVVDGDSYIVCMGF